MGEFINKLRERGDDLPPELAKALESLALSMDADAAATAREPEPEPETPPRLPVVQLPLWPEPARGSPNNFLRSSLFAAIQGKDRKYLKGELLAAQKGIEIRFTGMMLDQSDFDVWLQAVHLARMSPERNACVFKGNAFLKGIGRSNGNKDYIWLKGVLARLQSAVVEIKAGKHWRRFNLLNEAQGEDDSTVVKLQFNPLLIKLFGSDNWTSLEWEQRKALKGKPLALWLHGFYSSHAEPFPLSVDYLREKSGSRTKEKKHFKAALKKAFAELEAETGIKAAFAGDIVTVERLPTPSQARHVIRQITRGKRRKKAPE